MEVVTCVRGGERYFFVVELAPTLNAVPAPVRQIVVLWNPPNDGKRLANCGVRPFGVWRLTNDIGQTRLPLVLPALWF